MPLLTLQEILNARLLALAKANPVVTRRRLSFSRSPLQLRHRHFDSAQEENLFDSLVEYQRLQGQ